MSSQIDLTLHAPARLQIAAMLARADEVEFATIREVTQVSDSVLSKHLTALSEAGYVKIVKAPRDGRQRTWASLTRTGRSAFASHMNALRELAAAAEQAVGAR
ncbi:transcriptional regulator [Alteriqipengyuania lutimaris]|uniref:MarR family transcriptional regulator n=1 Tax=Alteriqipengyuania lutimaris TaxID=1538146 RepID=A0A395LHA8_9SPHN|nr:transcriptional regulator [Alteriqipengyuania lutimaris]MBB3034930.1 DNA-binding MarR family transcriptional regulator [Alteriqipengyuania lutimaris]RDS76243.1 MarR family transcriptional regulator [Alteriqipengyuania lutimaris]